ncbi:transferase hexapeptide domain containing protein [Grosmannia clavigera kw1407]|uniref:Dynactin subunit 6 n=1 Tax=Grosmannia clavigera (strain kw1407 / UAMH 11150) TaxID=655863 RepID=F0XMJ7_GROCL|nr:transferase hexapeptide domain containing protein [Grosmannia clavigera kw1407]EFX01157.1 transferase hexapeptide domain containing protein [Grosmannia clavigera kw1407]
MSKRPSALPAAPPTPVVFVGTSSDGTQSAAVTVVLADAVAIAGTFPVTFASDSVVHPRARLDARAGPLNIGRRCIIEERATLGGGPPSERGASTTVTLQDCVSVETGAQVEAGATIGSGTVVGARSIVGRGAVIGQYCTLAPRSVIAPGTRLPDYSVVFGNGRRRRDDRPAAAESRQRLQTRRIEVLRKLIPNMRDKYRS